MPNSASEIGQIGKQAHTKEIIFRVLFSYMFYVFVRKPFWIAFLAPKVPIYAPKDDFWSTLDFQGFQNGASERPFS